MARVTLIIDDDLLRRLRARAAEEGRTLSDLADELLRLGTQARVVKPGRTRPRLPTFSMGRPTVDISNRDLVDEQMTPQRRGRRRGGAMKFRCSA